MGPVLQVSQVVAGALVISLLTWGSICFQAHSLDCSQDSVPPELLERGPRFFYLLKAALSSLPCETLTISMVVRPETGGRGWEEAVSQVLGGGVGGMGRGRSGGVAIKKSQSFVT